VYPSDMGIPAPDFDRRPLADSDGGLVASVACAIDNNAVDSTVRRNPTAPRARDAPSKTVCKTGSD
jgi:hypothetical protein